MADFESLWVWKDPRLSARLRSYREVALNRAPARYLVARRLAVPADFRDLPEQGLWSLLDRLTPDFLALQAELRRGDRMPAVVRPNLLDLVVELSRRMLRHCNFCRWNCQVDRGAEGKRGACQLAEQSRVSSFFHHTGEELVLRGTRGSGTIFFTSCNMRCAFCQNGDISTDKDNGQPVTPRSLAAMARSLRLEGCHNINWVGGDPTIHLHTILEAISLLGKEPEGRDLMQALQVKADLFLSRYSEDAAGACYQGELNVPMLWNSNFFMSPEAMKLLRLTMDIWLPDFKFGPGACAVKLSRTPWYWETVTGNLALLEEGGEDYLIRHLVMPGHVECCTLPILDWIRDHAPEAPLNLMDQYHPDMACDPRHPTYQEKYAPLSRRLTREEFRQAVDYARRFDLNFESVTFEKSLLF